MCSNPDLPQLQILDSITLQNINKSNAKSTLSQITSPSHHVLSFVLLTFQDAPRLSKYKHNIKIKNQCNISCKSAHLHSRTMVRSPGFKVESGSPKGLQ